MRWGGRLRGKQSGKSTAASQTESGALDEKAQPVKKSGAGRKAGAGEIALEDYIGASCEIKSLYGEALAEGVADNLEAETLDVIGNGHPMFPVAHNTIVRVRLGGILPPFYGMGRVNLSTQSCLRIVDFRDVQSFERRLAFRVPVNIRAVIRRTLPPREDDPQQQPVVEEMEARVRNISSTGIYLSVDHAFSLGNMFEVEFLNRHEIFRMGCLVCRVEQGGDAPRYGCMFQDLHIQMTNRLCSLLYRLQAEQIRRIRGR